MIPVLQSRDVSVGRGRTPVLEHVELEVVRGERLALLGTNGSGKTSLLRAFAGLDRPSAGELLWEGHALPRGPARTQVLGVLFQSEAPARFTVHELVALGLGLDGPPTGAVRRRVAEQLERAGLTGLSHRSCAALSGGELQRALLARATIAGARLLLLDEPTNHLDLARQAALLTWLDGLRGSVAVVLATHDLQLAATCDRVALLHDGRLVELGPPQSVLTPGTLARTLGVRVRRLEDPDGGPPLLRVLASKEGEAAA